jgi:hypothetical protein
MSEPRDSGDRDPSGTSGSAPPGPSRSDAEDDDADDHSSRAAAVIGLVVIAFLVAIGLYVSNTLRATSRLQDCVMSGRTNCAPVQTPSGRS